MKELEGRIRKVEQAIRGVEDDQWRRSNPEARARAADTVAQLESSIADLQAKRDKAVAAGNAKKADEHAAAIEARESWLTEAQKAARATSPADPPCAHGRWSAGRTGHRCSRVGAAVTGVTG